MRSSTILVAVAAALLAAAGVAGLDLVVGGNPAALTGVIGASTFGDRLRSACSLAGRLR